MMLFFAFAIKILFLDFFYGHVYYCCFMSGVIKAGRRVFK